MNRKGKSVAELRSNLVTATENASLVEFTLRCEMPHTTKGKPYKSKPGHKRPKKGGK